VIFRYGVPSASVVNITAKVMKKAAVDIGTGTGMSIES
jgi:hypothetical protein